MVTSIANVNLDTLYNIFKISLPTSLSDPISSQADAKSFFSCTPPYNLTRTCRNWRNLALSSPSLWSSLFLSFNLPSSKDSIALRRAIERHISRSGKLPLTCFIKLSSGYKRTDALEIIFCLLERQKLWKRIGLYLDPRVASKVLLMIEDLKLLEELRIHNEVECSIESTSADVNLPSLTYLKLEVRSSEGALNWLKRAPNLQELYFYNTPSDRASHPGQANANPNPDDIISLTFLRRLQIGICTPSPHDASSPTRSLAFTIFAHTSCHALTELRVNLHGINCDEALLSFLRRSAPPLTTLSLGVFNCTRPQSSQRDRLSVEVLKLVPSVHSLCFQWEFNIYYFPEAVFRALTQTETILPALRHLEFAHIIAPMEKFLDVMSARWRSEHRKLKAVTFSGCVTKPLHSPLSDCRRFREFNYGDDPLKLPDTLKVVREYISEGLDYRARRYTTAELS